MNVSFVPPQIDVPRNAVVRLVSQMQDDSAVVNYSDVSTIDTAEALVGCYVMVKATDVSEDDLRMAGYGLEGYQVIDEHLGRIGQVQGIQELPGQHLLVVERASDEADGQDEGTQANDEVLIPLVDEFVLSFDESNRCIMVSLPQSLLDL